jgi:anti-sigma factor RsiW
MTHCPDRQLLIHGLIDNELDAANSLEIEAHLKRCSGCAEELRRLTALKAELARPELGYRAPAGLRDQILQSISSEPIKPAARIVSSNGTARGKWFAGGAAAALAASLALFLAVPQVATPSLQDEVVAGHVRSLLASHLTDVQTGNRHVVKPWFAGKIDFAPPVVDLADQGFPLVGGRLDYLHGRVVPALVYRRQLHTINLFVRPAESGSSPLAIATRHESYSIVRWRSDGLEFWAVSDVELNQLEQFEQLFLQRATNAPR